MYTKDIFQLAQHIKTLKPYRLYFQVFDYELEYETEIAE